jgi:predicted PurR-regulated permease PerM
VIIVSLAFWGSLWGIIGMILAVPLVVVIKIILEQSPPTTPLARMLSNE